MLLKANGANQQLEAKAIRDLQLAVKALQEDVEAFGKATAALKTWREQIESGMYR